MTKNHSKITQKSNVKNLTFCVKPQNSTLFVIFLLTRGGQNDGEWWKITENVGKCSISAGKILALSLLPLVFLNFSAAEQKRGPWKKIVEKNFLCKYKVRGSLWFATLKSEQLSNDGGYRRILPALLLH